MTAYLCDTSVWLALAISKHTHQALAKRWFDGIGDSDDILFCRAIQQSFLRLLTTQPVLTRFDFPALTNNEAWIIYEQFLSDPRVSFREEPAELEAWWPRYSARGTASPKLWMDAYLAAFARAGGYQMVTLDAAFQQFRDLDVLVIA